MLSRHKQWVPDSRERPAIFKPLTMKIFEGIQFLNPDEQQFLICLEAVNHESLWGQAIMNVMKEPTVTKIRTLIGDLKSQAGDNESVMLDILGAPCYQQLIAL
jgi:hypothetical protein